VKAELKAEIADVRTEIADVKAELKAEIADVRTEVAEVKEDLKSVKLTIENELRKSIRIVCEGHLDLYRKLCDALRYEREKEWMQIRINVLESDVRMIKSRMALCT
ncbi:MAG: hypothetical protein IJB96_09860, partial [Lachnospira sp.]|nr:hypothetical protein [Lachnospira sp.]